MHLIHYQKITATIAIAIAMITAIAMNESDHTALKKSYLLLVSFTYSAWTFKEYPILYF